MSNILHAQKVIQNNQEFLISVIPVKTLKNYTKYTERVIVGFDDSNLPIYNSEIQRKTDTSKVNLIADFLINDPDAMFPTNIVLAIPSFIIDDFIEENKSVTITLNPKLEEELKKENGDVFISVIDGQHRLRGIEMAINRLEKDIEILTADNSNPKKLVKFKEVLSNLLAFEIAVTFFVDPVLEYQASIFSTINRTQTKVSESLVYSLFGLTDKVSPQKSSLEITLSLNSVTTSPFYNRIKLVGQAYKRGESPPLTQAAMVKSLIKCISANAKESERDRFRPRAELLKGFTPDLCFRRYYANGQDLSISKIMFAYFGSVRQEFKDVNQYSFWDLEATPNILQTTVGYETLLNLMKLILIDIDVQIVSRLKKEDDKFLPETYRTYLERVTTIDFTNFDRYPKTSVTKSVLLDDFQLLVFPL